MKQAAGLSKIKEMLTDGGTTSHRELFIPTIGLLPLAYVFYAGFFDLPPILNNLIVFMSIFVGLSTVLYWKNKFFIPPLFIGYLGLFFLPLTWLWRGLELDDNILMSIFPFNDGMYYLMDAYRLLMGLEHMMAPNGRPLFSGVLTFLMWIFDGNVQIALALFVVGTAISIFILALEIREIAGPVTAGLASTILFYFYIPFLGRVYTENLGLNLGVLALALLLKAARKRSLAALVIGTFSLSLALNARAGAFFTLPALVIWAWVNRKTFGGGKAPLLLIGAIFLGFIINIFIIKSVGTKDENTFTNYGHSLYGLASGYKGWTYVYETHPEFNNGTNVVLLAAELILKNPILLFAGILLNYKDYFSPEIMFYLMRFADQQPVISWVLYLVTVAGLYRLVKSRDEIHMSLIIYFLVGIFLSMALIPSNDGGSRALMATNPVNALVAGLAFLPIKNQQKRDVANVRAALPEAYAIILGIACALGPIVAVNFPRTIPSLPVLNCPKGTEQISVIITPGSYINIVRNGPTFGFLPEVKQEDIKARLDDYYLQGNLPFILIDFPNFETLMKRFDPGDTILMGINLLELNQRDGPEQFIFLVTRTNRIQQIGDVNHFCARLSQADRLHNNRFYYDLSIQGKE